MNTPTNFKRGKEPRNQLELPTLHFIVTDQWTDVLSEKAIFAWLRMYSWCKRDEQETEVNLWEQARIPTSFNSLIKKLGVGKGTFYNQILKPLWNVGLIDIEEYTESDNKGNKPMNIIVYKYPQNNKSLAYQEIKEIRNYDKNYHSNAKTFAKKGGRPKNNKTDEQEDYDGSEIKPGVVPNKNQGWFQNKTRGGSEIKPNNIFNSFSNSFNILSNILNSFNKNLNSSSSKKNINQNRKEKTKINTKTEEEEKEKNIDQKVLQILENNPIFEKAGEFLHNRNVDKEIIQDTILELNTQNLDYFTEEQLRIQYDFMMDEIDKGKHIHSFSQYFVGGLKLRINHEQLSNQYQLEKQMEIERRKIESEKRKASGIYYDWLTE